MKRRQFLAAAGAGAVTTLATPAIAQTQPTIKWRLTSSFPKQLDTIYGTALQFSKYVSEATDGRFEIQCFAGGEIVPPLAALDAVSNATVECAQTPTYFYFGKEPTLGFGTGMPFGLNSRLQHSWWHFGGGEALINEALAKFNTIGMPMGNSGCQMGGFFRKEINSVADLSGLKFRVGGFPGRIFAKLGAVPQNVPPGDLYPALERGTIDAAEFVGPYDDEKLGLHKVAKYYYYPGFWEGGAVMHLVINTGKWAELPKAYQAIVRSAAEAANNWMIAKYDAVNPPAIKRLVAGGADLKPFPLPVMEAALKATNEIHAEIAAQNPLYKKTLESYDAFRGDGYLWWQIGEYSFDTLMVRTRGKG